MKFTLENTWYASLVIQFWIKNMIRVLFLKPAAYFKDIISQESTNNSLQTVDWNKVKKVVKGVQWISPAFAKKRKCLMEALVVYGTLKKVGISSTIRLGAKTTNDSIKTHAWVTIGNNTIIGGPIGNYKELIKTRRNP